MYEIIKEGNWIEGEPQIGQLCRKVIATSVGNVYEEFVFTGFEAKDLTLAKAEKILEIKAEAEHRVRLLDWRLERAREREALGIVGYETVTDIYQLKEAIRQWSNQIEVELMQLESIEAVNVFSVR